MKKTKEVPIFAIAADNWRKDVLSLSKYRTYYNGNVLLKLLIREFGHQKVTDITKHDIQKFVVRNSRRMGASWLRKYLTALRDVIEYADEDWEMPRRIKLPKAVSPKQPFYSFEEVRKLLQKSYGVEKVLLMFLAETGCRIGEALAIEGGDLNDNAVRITKNVIMGFVQDTPKTESAIRKVNLSQTLIKELNILARNKGFLFKNSNGRPLWPQSLVTWLKQVCHNAGVGYKPVHAFRRGNVRELLLHLRIPERVVGMRIGHKSSENLLLGVYCQTQDDDDLQYVSQIEKWLYKGEAQSS